MRPRGGRVRRLNENLNSSLRVNLYVKIQDMSKAEILEQLPNLTAAERFEIRLKLAELDGETWVDDDDPLTEDQQALLVARLDDMERHPENSIPWDEARKSIESRFGK